MVEAVAGGPRGQGGLAELSEKFLEAFEDFAGAGIARGNGAAGTGMAAFEIHLADFEADDAAFFFAKELIFPEGRDAIDFECGAETLADFIHTNAGKAPGCWRKPPGDCMQRGGGNDGGAAGDGFIGEAVFGVAHDDLLLEEDAEPFGGVIVSLGEGEGARGNFAAVAGNRERDAVEVRRIAGADEMDGGGTLPVDPFAVDGIERPGAIKLEATGGGNAGFGDGDRIKRLDGMETDVCEDGSRFRRGHISSLKGDEVKKQ